MHLNRLKTESFKSTDAKLNNNDSSVCLLTDEQLTKICKKIFTKPSKNCLYNFLKSLFF